MLCGFMVFIRKKCSQGVGMFPVVAQQNTESGHSPEHKYLELPEIAEGQGVWKDEGAWTGKYENEWSMIDWSLSYW